MTADDGRRGGPVGPPWSVDVLADLHAGVFGEEETRQLLTRVRGDAEAEAVLAALDATRADIADLGSPDAVAPVPIPDHVAARIDSAMAAETAARTTGGPPPSPRAAEERPLAPVVDIAAARKRRNRVVGWGSGAVAVAAAVIAVVLVVVPGTRTTPGQGVAAAPPAGSNGQPPLALGSGKLGRAALGKALQRRQPGPFADQQKLRGCLRANQVDPSDPKVSVVGTARVTRNGQAGTLLVLTTGKAATFRMLVVDNSCAANNPATIDNTVVGPK